MEETADHESTCGTEPPAKRLKTAWFQEMGGLSPEQKRLFVAEFKANWLAMLEAQMQAQKLEARQPIVMERWGAAGAKAFGELSAREPAAADRCFAMISMRPHHQTELMNLRALLERNLKENKELAAREESVGRKLQEMEAELGGLLGAREAEAEAAAAE